MQPRIISLDSLPGSLMLPQTIILLFSDFTDIYYLYLNSIVKTRSPRDT